MDRAPLLGMGAVEARYCRRRAPLRLRASDGQRPVMAPDGTVLGDLQAVLNPDHRGLLRAVVSTEANKVDIFYHGPDDLWLA